MDSIPPSPGFLAQVLWVRSSGPGPLAQSLLPSPSGPGSLDQIEGTEDGQTDGWRDGWTEIPCILQDIAPLTQSISHLKIGRAEHMLFLDNWLTDKECFEQVYFVFTRNGSPWFGFVWCFYILFYIKDLSDESQSFVSVGFSIIGLIPRV